MSGPAYGHQKSHETQNAAPSRFAGFFGWWIVAAGFVIYFMSAGLLGTGTVYFKPLSAEFGGTAAGVLFDMTGSYDIAFGLGLVLCGVGCGLMALAKAPASRAAETKAVLPVLLPEP